MRGEPDINHVMQLQKLEALGRFAGGMAHDFNNILSIIEGYASIAERQLKEGTLEPAQLQKIMASAQRGAGLTRQLLAFARQKVDIEEKLNLNHELEQQQVLLKPILGENISLYMAGTKMPVWVNLSRDRLMQVVMNMAINARDAMPDGGKFYIDCQECKPEDLPKALRKKTNSFVRISFIDEGLGIPPDILPRVFDPFFTTKDASKGTGLGLSVVYGIADQSGGIVDVSSGPGEGTAFNLYLPQVEPPEDIGFVYREESVPDHISLKGRTILVAEDEPELRDVLTVMLENMEMKVLGAANGNDALLVQDDYDGDIDFLLTDVVMPEMNGQRLGELFTSLRPDSNIIYMSGYPFLDNVNDRDLPEDAPFISKPLREETVRQVLQRALQRRDDRLKEETEHGH